MADSGTAWVRVGPGPGRPGAGKTGAPPVGGTGRGSDTMAKSYFKNAAVVTQTPPTRMLTGSPNTNDDIQVNVSARPTSVRVPVKVKGKHRHSGSHGAPQRTCSKLNRCRLVHKTKKRGGSTAGLGIKDAKGPRASFNSLLTRPMCADACSGTEAEVREERRTRRGRRERGRTRACVSTVSRSPHGARPCSREQPRLRPRGAQHPRNPVE